MENKPNTKIWTYLNYKEVYNEITSNTLILPISYLDDVNNIDRLVSDIIKDFISIEAISFSSFVNMICQTIEAEEIWKLTNKELNATGIAQSPFPNKILFNRDCLLYFISQIVKKNEEGTLNITGQGNKNNAKEYYKSLLLINCKHNIISDNIKTNFYKDYFIRSYPYSYDPKLVEFIYLKRIQRYWYIYNICLNNLDDSRKQNINDALKNIQSKITIKEYFQVIFELFIWFLMVPLARSKPAYEHIKGFNYNDITSFYF